MPASLKSQGSVRVSRRSFALWWSSLLLLHGVAGAFFGGSAYFYWQLEGTSFDYFLQFYGVSFGGRWYSTVATLLALVALPHALAITKMVGASLYYRAFTFSFGSATVQGAQSVKHKTTNRQQCKTWRCMPLLLRLQWPAKAVKVYNFFSDRTGVFGVEGKYFHAIMFIRELVETSLQTYQAYNMSVHLERVWLNRFYVTLLVLNCCLTPLIHHVYKRNEAKKRLLCLVCDCALDLVSSVVIPCTILVTYYSSFASEGNLFDIVAVQGEVWFMQVVNELQLLFVISWRDLASRLVFSLGLVIAMGDVKELVVGVYVTNQVNPFAVVIPGAASTVAGPSMEVALTAKAHIDPAEGLARPQRPQNASANAISFTEMCFRHLATLIHGSLLLWGAIVLGLHVYAESHLRLPQCLFQVRPWGEAKHVCTLVLLDCYSSRIAGSEEETDAEWNILDERAVTRIQIRHCPALEMSPVLQRFSQLLSLKFYNSTIVQWNDDAAITTTHHPQLTLLFFIRVNFTDGELPLGLLSTDFPVTIDDIEFSVTNLRSLPSDLDARWPQPTTLYLENGAFTSVPEAVLLMRPIFLSFYGNPIQELPSELFEGDTIMFLHIGDTLATSLPANVTFDANTSSLWYLYMSNTQISYFPVWFDGMVTAALAQDRLPIFASETPYCSQLEQIQAGLVSEFTITQSDQSLPLSVLMDTSLESLDVIRRTVSCTPNDGAAFFLLALEDEKNRIVA